MDGLLYEVLAGWFHKYNNATLQPYLLIWQDSQIDYKCQIGPSESGITHMIEMKVLLDNYLVLLAICNINLNKISYKSFNFATIGLADIS